MSKMQSRCLYSPNVSIVCGAFYIVCGAFYIVCGAFYIVCGALFIVLVFFNQCGH